ncbi:ABC transporter ATP-binding protein [Treponema sp. C6A8]|uniref:ABC transporter ATP-binding protein n=1 Tax=Treponema sp. C6A8 TaxID=1410609 RepID=UPI000570B7F9|nr:ABC transporter ATP-binding protein [Treponema sp. C6A8]
MKSRLSNYIKVFKILTPRQKRICFVIVIMMFIGAVLETAGIGLLYPLISIIGDTESIIKVVKFPFIQKILLKLGVNSHIRFIVFSSVFLLIFYIIKNIFIFYLNKKLIDFSLNNQKDYTVRLYEYYLRKPYLFHTKTNYSVINRNVSSGGDYVFMVILNYTLNIITELITLLVIWGFLLLVDWLIALVTFFVIGPVILVMMIYFRKRLTKLGIIQSRASAAYGKWLVQGFFSIKETKVLQKEDFYINQFNKVYSEYIDSSKHAKEINFIPKSLIEVIAMSGIIMLIIIEVLIKRDPAAIIPVMSVLALAAVRLMPGVTRIINYLNSIKFQMPLFLELYDDLIAVKNNKKFETPFFKEEKKYIPFNDRIEVKDVCFKYPETEKEILHNVNFVIPKGKFVGIIGSSGAGKTTFVDILLGLLKPQSGKILIDGLDANENLSAWLNHLAYVPQSIYLLDASIRENIAIGVDTDKIDDEKMEKVLKMAELYDFVQGLPEKENTGVGDKGARISGGQRQRIGIARALYQDPDVLVLDEATSALDTETECAITETIQKLKGQITIIAIAHRLSTLEKCDFKIKFENGVAEIV